MREIKFRAWDGKQMYLPEYSDHENFCIQADGTITKYQEVGYERHLMQFILGDNWFLMQYTGLKDKNGKEIYEGDIMRRFTGYTFEVKPEWFSLGGLNMTKCFGYQLHEGDEIIGNIYENHELCSQPLT